MKLSGQTDFLTELSKSIDKIILESEIQTKHQYRNDFDEFGKFKKK